MNIQRAKNPSRAALVLATLSLGIGCTAQAVSVPAATQIAVLA